MMGKLGVFVGEDQNWTFFREVFDDLARRHQTRVYRERVYRTPLLYGRLNRWAFQRQIRSMLYDNDLCFFEWASQLLAAASTMPKRAAIVTRLHAFELYAWAPRIDWDRVDRVIFVSHAKAKRFAEMYPEHFSKARVVYNGVALDRFRPAKRNFGFDLGMLCAFHPRKRIYDVVLSLHALRRNGHPARLHLGGGWSQGPWHAEYHAAIRDLVHDLGLERAVVFHGEVSDPARWFNGVDVFISNGYREGQQVALIEAMASGCWCLSHRWDGAQEMLPEENLFLSPVDLEEKIIAFADRTEAARAAGAAAMRAIAERKFDLEATKAGIAAVIDEVLAER